MDQPEPDPREASSEVAPSEEDLSDENFIVEFVDPLQLEPPEVMEIPGEVAPTILDILNADCWRIILDNLYINDVLLSETVSRAWQQMVHEYLRGVHRYQIGSDDSDEKHDCQRVILKNNKKSSKAFCGMLARFGPLIKKLVTNYVTRKGYRAMAANCPNLEDLTLYSLQINAIIQRFPKVYDNLKRLKFEWCDCLEDDCLSLMAIGLKMEELTINQFEVPATFMRELQYSRLTTLSLNYCEYLLFDDDTAEFLSAIEPSYVLTKLVLDRNSTRVIRDMFYVIKKLPNLEELSINYCKMMEPRDGDDLVNVIGGLKNLRHLNMKRNNNVSDALLEAVAGGCKDLRTLNIGYCVAVSGRAVAAACQELPKLTDLNVAGNPRITDDHLIKCITACPDLKELEASGCARVSARLVAAARARPARLRLRLRGAALAAPQVIEELSKGGGNPRLWAPVRGCFWTPKVTRMAQQGDLTVIWNESPVTSPSSSDQEVSSDAWTDTENSR